MHIWHNSKQCWFHVSPLCLWYIFFIAQMYFGFLGTGFGVMILVLTFFFLVTSLIRWSLKGLIDLLKLPKVIWNHSCEPGSYSIWLLNSVLFRLDGSFLSALFVNIYQLYLIHLQLFCYVLITLIRLCVP